MLTLAKVESRRHGRLKTEMLECKGLGAVQDLSASGLRVLIKGKCPVKVSQTLCATLSFEEISLPVELRVMWLEPAGFRKHMAGMAFVNPSPETAAGIQKLALAAVKALHPSFH